MSLAIRVVSTEDAVVLELAGDFDIAAVPRFRRIAGSVAPTTRLLAVDLRNVGFMDSSGLGELLRLATTARDARRPVALVFEDLRYTEILRIAQLTDRFLVARSVGEAISAFREEDRGHEPPAPSQIRA
jgi:anti-anti-sigma factor